MHHLLLLINYSLNQIPSKFLKIYLQNIRDLRSKTFECHIHLDLPHLLCFSEHPLNQSELYLI